MKKKTYHILYYNRLHCISLINVLCSKKDKFRKWSGKKKKKMTQDKYNTVLIERLKNCQSKTALKRMR